MFLLDTNVVSELMRLAPNEKVLAWFDLQKSGQLYISSVVWYELSIGIEALPSGRKKNALKLALQGVRDDFFDSRVLPFDEQSASLLSTQMADAMRHGKSASLSDAQIAATALQHRLTVVTRDVAPFQALGVKVLNPWGNKP